MDPWLLDPNKSSNDQADGGFEDSFSSVPVPVPGSGSEFRKLDDSAQYLAALEAKLERIQKKKAKSSDLVQGLQLRREDEMRRILDRDAQQVQTEQLALSETDDLEGLQDPGSVQLLMDRGVYLGESALLRRIAPERQALAVEESQPLVPKDNNPEEAPKEPDEDNKSEDSAER